ncbi:MAG: tripartite tricarboxylate transporter substrate binding protein [Ramlibacter sp.]|uniref:tripartite tricarboxylate transporter substrate binding protein n=1 Tax=Ramlibacter sp. TaxID=1917967 RepID=UPI0026292CF0|nr:tripartite tricarboxylate transporter substrate binding protein [Ramlibacter sp.]MDH4378142.1 tripartite tricarboxylate transporter substrate binding protein [Ramlibacter sp.]
MTNFTSLLRRTAAAALMLATVHSAIAQSFPARTISIVTTLPPGSTVDVLARVFGQQLSQRLNESVVIESKAGAGLMLGMQAVAAAAADGHTLAFTPVTPLTIQTHRVKNAGYALDSFVPLCQTFENIFFLAVSPKSDIKDAAALIARLKREPGKFSYGHSGSGSAPHLMAEEFWRALGLQAGDVPYRGETAFFPDLTSGTLEGGMVTTAGLQQHGFKPLVVFGTARSKVFPDVPTVAELGAQVTPSGYGGVFVRRGTAPEVVTRLEGLCRDIVNSPAYQQRAESLQQNATYLDRTAFAQRLQNDHASKGRLLPNLKIVD